MQQFAAREIGQRIATARREGGGMTQDDLAEALNVSKRSLQDYESGATIPWKHFQKLTSIFNRPLEWFIHGEEADQTAEPAVAPDVGERLDRIERLLETLVAQADPDAPAASQ